MAIVAVLFQVFLPQLAKRAKETAHRVIKGIMEGRVAPGKTLRKLNPSKGVQKISVLL